jgi:hypothetical protein
MDDQRHPSAPAARDVAAAWLLCAMIAALALGLIGNLHGGVPPAATVAATAAPCPSVPGSVCQLSADTAGRRVGAIAGLHRLIPPTPHSLNQHRPG